MPAGLSTTSQPHGSGCVIVALSPLFARIRQDQSLMGDYNGTGGSEMNNFVTYVKIAGAVVVALVLTRVAFFVMHMAMGIVRLLLWLVVWGFIFVVIHHLFIKPKSDTPTDI